MSFQEDRDIKIAHFSTEKKKPAMEFDEEPDRLFDHKLNGNTEKARLLGASVVREMLVGDINARFQIVDDKMYAYQPQIRLLITFAAIVGLQTKLPDALLSQMALSAFYETIQNALPAFYEDIADSGSFSVYYLAYRRGEEVEENIGRSFAAVCDKDKNETFIALGRSLFSQGLLLVEKQAAAADFIGIAP